MRTIRFKRAVLDIWAGGVGKQGAARYRPRVVQSVAPCGGGGSAAGGSTKIFRDSDGAKEMALNNDEIAYSAPPLSKKRDEVLQHLNSDSPDRLLEHRHSPHSASSMRAPASAVTSQSSYPSTGAHMPAPHIYRTLIEIVMSDRGGDDAADSSAPTTAEGGVRPPATASSDGTSGPTPRAVPASAAAGATSVDVAVTGGGGGQAVPPTGDSAALSNAIVFENTYRMKPDKKFQSEPVRRAAEAVLEATLQKAKYSPEKTPELAQRLSDEIMDAVK
ncbi:hypothetical protein HK405_005182, partial [Cladochytrium tenue]